MLGTISPTERDGAETDWRCISNYHVCRDTIASRQHKLLLADMVYMQWHE